MIPGPVFQFELLTLARRRRFYVFRFAFGAFLLFLLWANDPRINYRDGELTISEAKYLATTLFGVIATTLGCAVLFVTPALVAGVIADERQRKTLHYLLASSLTSSEIVIGKLAARLVLLTVMLGLTVPILLLLSLFGGVDPYEAAVFGICCFTTAFLIGSAAVASSVHARKPMEAISGVYAAGGLWLLGPLLVQWLLPYAGGIFLQLYECIKPLNDLLGLSSPLFVLLDVGRRFPGRQVFAAEFLKMAGIQTVFGFAILAYAIARLRPLFRNESDVRRRRWIPTSARAWRILPRPSCGDDAMLWKEMYVSKTTARSKIVGIIMSLVVAGFLGYYTYDFGKAALSEVLSSGYGSGAASSGRREFNAYLRVVETMAVIFWVLGVAMTAASSLSGEREADTWVSLVTTPLTPEEIVRGKMVGSLWMTRWIGAVWLFLLITGVVLGAIHPFGAMASLLITIVYLGFAVAIGTYYSLVAKNSSRALISTIFTLFLLNGVYLILFIPFVMESSIRLLGVIPFIEAVSLISYDEFNTLFGYGPQYSRFEDVVDFFLTGAASFLVYGTAAVGLTLHLLMKFDDIIDRPRTSAWRVPAPVEKPHEIEEI